MKRILALFILLFALSGCERVHPEIEKLVDYQQRLANILEVEALYNQTNDSLSLHQSKINHSPSPDLLTSNEQTSIKFKKYPSSKRLKIPLEELTIGWRDFFTLAECTQLQQLIGARNNQMGKTMEPATALFYEIKLKSLLASCLIQSPEIASKMKPTLIEIDKRFASKVWNNTWASHYWRKMMGHHASHQAVTVVQIEAITDALQAIRVQVVNSELQSVSIANDSIAHIKQTKNPEKADQTVNQEKWYRAFQTIEKSSGSIGALSDELYLHSVLLDQSTKLIVDNLSMVCPLGQPTQKFDYLNNVLNKFYFAQIQNRQVSLIKSATLIEQEFYQWLRYFSRKNAVDSPSHSANDAKVENAATQPSSKALLPTIWTEWLSKTFSTVSNNSLRQRLKQSIANHVNAWKKIHQSCSAQVSPQPSNLSTTYRKLSETSFAATSDSSHLLRHFRVL